MKNESARWRSPLRGRLWWLVAIPVLLLAAYVVVARQLMLLVPDYREELEAVLEEHLGFAIVIEQLDGSMDGLTPRFEVRGLTLPHAEDQAALRLDQVSASVSILPTLFHRDLYLRELRIKGVDVHLVRGENGGIRLRGLEVLQDREQGDAADGLRALYRQQRILIEDARFSLDWPGLPPLAASSLTLALDNSGDGHALSVRVEARDRPFSVDARLRVDGDPLSLDQLNARGYLDVNGERLHEWLPEGRDWPLDLAGLDGRVRAWAAITSGQVRSAQVRLGAPSATLTDGDQPWRLTDINLDAQLSRSPNGDGQLSVTAFSGQTPAGAVAPGPLALSWRIAEGGAHWRFQGEDLAIHALSRQLSQWPFALPEGLGTIRDRLREHQPRGVLQQLYLAGVEGRVDAIQARFTGLAADALDRVPGARGLNGWVAGGPQHGVARVNGDPLQLTVPRLYDHPLSFRFNGVLRWFNEAGRWSVETGTLMAANADARGVAMFRLEGGEGLPVPELRLIADLRDGDAARAAHYVPMEKLPDPLSEWLAQAFRGGRLDQGRILYRGPIKIEPEQQQDRTFQMRFQGRDLSLSFLPEWPMATGIEADVLIDGRQLTGQVAQGRLFDTELSEVTVDLPAVDPSRRHLVIQGHVQGPATDLDRLFHDTPLAKQLPAELLDWRFAAGQVNGHLLLDLPLTKNGSEPMVIVDGRGEGVTLANQDLDLTLTDVTAPVYFHLREGMNMPRLEGKALGGSFTGSWLTRGPDSQMQLTGSLPVARLRDWLDVDWPMPVSGRLPLELELGMPWRGMPLRVEGRSTLQGVKVDAPAPLGKSAETLRGSRLVWRAGREQSLSVHYGQVAQGRFRTGDAFAGALGLGGVTPPDLPEQGLVIEGRVERAGASEWLDFVQGLNAVDPQSGGQGAAPSLIRRVAVTVADLDLFGVALSDARLIAAPRLEGWEFNMAAPAMAASLRVPENYQARGGRPLTLDISRLRLPDNPLTGGAGGGDQAAPVAPTAVPVMDVTLADARVGGEALGDWSARIRPVEGGVRAEALRGQWRGVRVDGNLTWTGTEAGGQRTRYQGSVVSDDLKDAFTAWGLPVLLESEDARATLDLSWPDWPLSPNYLALRGDAQLDVGKCLIPDPQKRTSVLRVLGVINMANLQRRLRLDFSDLYQEGLSCDSIKGDFIFNGATLTNRNVSIESPSAAFEVNGQVDLAAQTLDQEVAMTLPLSSNLYAGCLAGPAVCAGIFVVERLWGDKLDKTTTITYRVSGPWQDPKVKETEGFLE
ncbi:MAG TPA: YhdP family protein [Alcanivorax sp.]|nr:YhdP family protein [Alcanivorax sp.]